MTIHRTITDSSMIQEIEYDDDSKILTVTFSKSSKYEYYYVPKEVYEGLINAESIGKYFAANIKGKYETLKI